MKVQEFQKLGNRLDFVGLLVHHHLSEGKVGLGGPGTDHMQWPERRIARATKGLAVDGNMAKAQEFTHGSKPLQAAALECPAIQRGEHSLKGVVRRNAIG